MNKRLLISLSLFAGLSVAGSASHAQEAPEVVPIPIIITEAGPLYDMRVTTPDNPDWLVKTIIGGIYDKETADAAAPGLEEAFRHFDEDKLKIGSKELAKLYYSYECFGSDELAGILSAVPEKDEVQAPELRQLLLRTPAP